MATRRVQRLVLSLRARRLLYPANRPYARAFSHSTKSTAQEDQAFHSQLSDANASGILSSLKSAGSVRPAQTLTEKIFQRHALNLAEDKTVRAGDFITLSPRRCMTHDNSWPVALKFMEMGASNLHDPDQIVMTLDHDVQNKSESNLKKYRQIERFAQQQGVDFYPAGHGIGHQIMVEEGYAWPGTVSVASDSHTNMYGGIGCLGTPVVRTGAADIWATGTTWFKIPPIAKVTFTGTLAKGVTGKDVIVALCGVFNNDEVLNHCIEFVGSEETMKSLPIDYRLAIANMTTEWGALSGLFPIDSVLQGWLRWKATEASMAQDANVNGPPGHTRFTHELIDELTSSHSLDSLRADRNARYAKTLFLDLGSVPPFVSGPNSVKVATPLQDLQKQNIKVDKAYLISCTNSRASDIAAAARVFTEANARGERSRIADGVKLYIAAASAAEQSFAEAEGDWQTLLAAGAEPLPSGCGPCIGLGTGLLEPGENGISASNRNFKGRMGSTDAKAYLASPEVVAASALNGYISGTGWYEQPKDYHGIVAGEGDTMQRRVVGVEEALEKLLGQANDLIADAEHNTSSTSNTTTSEIVPGFPERIEGEIVFCDADNINTDGIYPGKYTYQDNITRDVMADVCMSNYDTAFKDLARPGDILVAGFNFGCGSSREQAATAILAKDIPLVIAGSFGNIFATNSINNALMGLEVPRLVQRLREEFAAGSSVSAENNTKAVTEPEVNQQSLDSAPPGPAAVPQGEKVLSRRTGWKVVWDVRKSTVHVTEGNGAEWTESVPEIPPNVQEIVAGGGLVKARQSLFAGKS